MLDKDIKETGRVRKVPIDYNHENNLWEDGYFAETLGSKETKEKMRTFHKGHDEDMNFNCKKCNKKISVHNKDWHNGMCDDCFNKKYY